MDVLFFPAFTGAFFTADFFGIDAAFVAAIRFAHRFFKAVTSYRVTLLRDAKRVHEMTRADLTERVCQAIAMSIKESDVVVCAIFDAIVRAVRSGDKVEIRGFGTFHTRQRRGRIARNPKTGAPVEVPPKRIPFFKPSKELRQLIDSLNVNA